MLKHKSRRAGRRATLSTERKALTAASYIALLASLGISALPETALAQTWIGSASGNWSAGSNWQGGIAPVSGPTTSLVFTGGGTNGWTSTNDLGAFQLNSLTLNTRYSGPTLPTIASSTGNSLQFTGSNPSIVLAGAGSNTISSAINLAATTTITGSGFGNLVSTGIISGSGGLVISATPQTLNTQTIQLSGANTFTGGVTLNSGNLTIGNASALGTGTFAVNGGVITAASSLTINNAVQVSGGLNYFANTSVLTLGSGGSLSGTGGISLTGAGGLNIQNAATLSGTATLGFRNIGDQFMGSRQAPYTSGSQLQLSGATGSALNLTAFNITNGGSLNLNNTAGANNNRVADNAAINLKGGFLTMNGNASTAVSETVGAISGEGQSVISVAPTSATGANVQLTAASLNRVNNGTFLFRGIGLGNTSGTGVGNLFFTSAPTLFGGGGASGTASISILPYAVAERATLGVGSDLVTYDATTGIRPLSASEYRTSLAAAAANENVKLTSGDVLNSNQTVNALVMTGSTLSGSGTLTLGSGTFLGAGNGTTLVDVGLNFGSKEAILFSTGSNTSVVQFNKGLTGTGGVTKAGNALMVFAGDNSGLTGTFRINNGAIGFVNESNLPGTGAIEMVGTIANVPVYMPGLYYMGAGDTTINRNLNIADGAVVFGNDTNTGNVTYAGTISGNGGIRIVTNTGMIVLAGNNTYTGPTAIAGRVGITSDASFGNGGSVDFSGNNNATGLGLTLLGDWTTDRLITTSLGTLINTNGFNATLNGLVTGATNGGFFKDGAGTLTITSNSPLAGGITVNQGTYALAGNGATLSLGHTVNTGAQFHLDNSGTAVSDRVNDGSTTTLSGGELRMTGNASAAVSENLGALVLGASTSGNVVTIDTPGASSILNFSNYTPNGASILFRGTNLGTAGAAQIFFANLSVNQLLANALYDGTAIGNGLGATGGLAWYDTAVGVRKMLDTDFIKVGPTQSFAAIQNSAPVNLPTAASVWAIGATSTGAAGENNTIAALRLGSDSSVAIQSGTTLNVSTGNILVDSGTATGQTISGGTMTAGSAALTVTQGNTAAPTTISSALTGTGGLFKTGAGQLNLTGSYGITGALTVAAGTLDMSGIAGGATTGAIAVNDGASLIAGAAGVTPSTVTFNGSGTIDGLVKFANGSGQTTVATFNGVGDGTINTDFTYSGTGGNTNVFSSNNTGGQTVTLSGKLSGGSSAANTVMDFRNVGGDGTGAFKLTNTANDFQGTVQVFSGKLAVSDSAALGNAANTVRLNAPGANGGLRFDADMTFDRTVLMSGQSGFDTNGHNVTMTGALTGTAGTFNKNGAGRLNLTGTATPFGPVIRVNAGDLAVNTALAAGTAGGTGNIVQVNDGATLSGAGSITLNNSGNEAAKIRLLNGGMLSPGNGDIGTLTMTRFTWDAGGIMNFELGAPGTSDLLSLTGLFEKGDGTGTWNWMLTSLSGVAPGDYTLVNFGSTNFSASDMSYTGLDGYNGTFEITSNSVVLHVTTSVPEPSALWLLALGGGVGLLFRLRVRRS